MCELDEVLLESLVMMYYEVSVGNEDTTRRIGTLTRIIKLNGFGGRVGQPLPKEKSLPSACDHV